MRTAIGYVLPGLLGAFAGFLLLTVAANLEQWQFYTIRSYATGKTVMSEIVAQPANKWIYFILYVVSIGGGVVTGVLFAWWLKQGRRRRA
jgi:hypothetical protein